MSQGRLGVTSFEQDVKRIRTAIGAMPAVVGGLSHGRLINLDADDHPQYVHLAAGRTITGQHMFAPAATQAPFVLGANAQGQLVSGLRADQLNKSVLPGDGLAGGGLLTGDVTLALATPGTLDIASPNNPAGNHTHSIVASSNPGAAESLLKSDASGSVQLVRLGLGVAPSFPLHVQGAAPQLRLQVDGTHAATIGVDASDNLELVTGNNLHLYPGGDAVFNPGGKDVLPLANYDLNLGLINRKWLALHAAELWVETLVAQNTLATIGGRILMGPTTTLTSDLAAATTTIEVKHNQLASGDVVYLEAGGQVEFMAVTGGPTGTGPYSYTVTRNLDGTGANDWYAGDAVFNTGAAGDGFIDLYSLSGVNGGAGPTIVGNVRNSATYNDWSERWAVGNLNGLYGQGTKYGVAFGDPTAENLIITAEDGIKFRNSATVLGSLSSTAWVLGQAADNRIEITPTELSLYDQGSVKRFSLTSNALWLGTDNGTRLAYDTTNGLRLYTSTTPIIKFPPSGTAEIQGTLAVTGSLTAGAGVVVLSPSGIRITPTTSYPGGTSPRVLAWGADSFIEAVSSGTYKSLRLKSLPSGASSPAATVETRIVEATQVAQVNIASTETIIASSFIDLNGVVTLGSYISGDARLTGGLTVGSSTDLAGTGDIHATGEIRAGGISTAGVRMHTISLADNAWAQLHPTTAAPHGFVFIINSAGAPAIFYLHSTAGIVTSIHITGWAFTTTVNTDGYTNVYWSPTGSAYRIQNMSGASRTYTMLYFD